MAGKLAPVSHVRHGSLGLLLFSFFSFSDSLVSHKLSPFSR
jgi:hypothetical protein